MLGLQGIREFREYKRTKPKFIPGIEVLVLDTYLSTADLVSKIDYITEMLAAKL